MHDEMLSIGQISKIVDISTDTLRYYDDINLLKPCFIDPSTKYRYYTKLKIRQLTHILELKQIGFSLEAIKLILNQNQNTSLLQELYKTKAYELKQEKAAIENKIENLEKKIQIKGDGVMNKTAIIVDDVLFMNNTVKEILERNGYSIISQAFNGLEAVEQYKEHKPNLVVMDITMPKMDGIDALKKIKEYDTDANVIMCTGYCQPDMILRCIQSGACEYIVKPFYPDTLVTLSDEAVNNKHSFDNQAIKELLNDQRLILLSKKNIIITQEIVQKIVDACRGGEREFLEKLE